MEQKYLEKATFTDMMIAFLFSARSTFIYKKILFERLQNRQGISNHKFSQRLHYLKSRGLIEVSEEKVHLSEKGKKFYSDQIIFRKNIESPRKEYGIILIFDIPERKRKIRNWLRAQLKDWGFKMVQQSVWKGHGPMSKEFDSHLSLLGIKDCVKIMKIAPK